MTDTHLSTDELVIIESYFHQNTSVTQISKQVGRARQTVHNRVTFLRDGHTALDYYKRYKQNKKRCGRKQTVLSADQQRYVEEKVARGWAPDVITERKTHSINCSGRTLYRLFKRNISERETDYPAFNEAFGHLEGDTIVGVHHKSAIITLVERLSKAIITLKPEGRTAKDIETTLNTWCHQMPRNLFKSITFDCGKEFSNWRPISNHNDLSIYFADPGTPSQRGLNEHSNELLRIDGLPKGMDFNPMDQQFVSSVSAKRNHIPRKSLDYQTPLEVFLVTWVRKNCLAYFDKRKYILMGN